MRLKNSIGLSVLSAIVMLTTSGCDLIDTAKEFFNKKTSTQTQTATKTPMASPDKPLSGNEVARVGGWRISLEEFNERLTALKEVLPDFDETDVESKKMVLDELVRQQLVVADAERTGAGNDPEIRDAVEEFRRTLIVRQTAAKITADISVSDEEIVAFYDENKEILINPIEMKVRSIVLETQPEANDLLIQLLQGADFAEMAKQKSIGDNAAQGGDMGWIADVPFPEMANALIPLEKGDISSVFRGPDGFYIVKAEDKKGGETIPLEDVKEDIRQNRIIFKQQQAIESYIEGLRGKIKIETNEALLSK